MNDIAIITHGNQSQINLVPAIKEIEKIIKEKEARFKKEIAPYEESLNQLRRINTVCEKCMGAGHVLRNRVCAEDDRPNPNDPSDWVECKKCYGTGTIRSEEPLWKKQKQILD